MAVTSTMLIGATVVILSKMGSNHGMGIESQVQRWFLAKELLECREVMVKPALEEGQWEEPSGTPKDLGNIHFKLSRRESKE